MLLLGLVCLGLPWAQAPAGSAQNPEQSAQAKPPARATQGTHDDAVGDADEETSDDGGPSPGDFLGSTYVPSINEANPAGGAQATLAAAVPPPPTPVAADAGGDAVRQQINNETANLLALAYALKAEVDKTNKDQLSIAVVRKANQIEQLARKMRDEIKPTVLSKN